MPFAISHVVNFPVRANKVSACKQDEVNATPSVIERALVLLVCHDYPLLSDVIGEGEMPVIALNTLCEAIESRLSWV